jgi:hypothetical protein
MQLPGGTEENHEIPTVRIVCLLADIEHGTSRYEVILEKGGYRLYEQACKSYYAWFLIVTVACGRQSFTAGYVLMHYTVCIVRYSAISHQK